MLHLFVCRRHSWERHRRSREQRPHESVGDALESILGASGLRPGRSQLRPVRFRQHPGHSRARGHVHHTPTSFAMESQATLRPHMLSVFVHWQLSD